MRRRHIVWGLILTGVAVPLSSPVSASLFEPVSDAQLVCEATEVIQGQVTEVQAAWDEARTAIWTTANVQVTDVLRGTTSRNAVITVKEVGGTVDDYTIRAEGFPTFRQGEAVVLLLRPWEDGSGTYRVWGYGRGMFALVQGKGREATTHRYDVVESGHPTMFTDRIPPMIVLEALTRELSALARACEQRGDR